jgi:F420-dependent oxidoreductase-like protein
MTQIGIMIEGQQGLNWTRWQRILQAAEDFGYQCVFRSDHFTDPFPPDYDSLELWVSLTYAAIHTRRIEFGPLVVPTTFRHPSMTVRMAAAVDDLSGGRLVLGMGAGWNEREHTQFGVPFHDFKTRFAMLTDALEITTHLLHDAVPVSYSGQHFALNEAVLLPRPARPGGPPILIGGNGPTRTLPLVVKYAREWNAVYLPLPVYRERSQQLNELLTQAGRQPGDVKRSLMTQVVFGQDDTALKAKLEDRDAQGMIENGLIVGTPSAVVDQIGRWVEAGVERFMLQWLNQDDIAGLEHMARDVLPHFHKA